MLDWTLTKMVYNTSHDKRSRTEMVLPKPRGGREAGRLEGQETSDEHRGEAI
jgi:hypothetical protein